MRYERPPTEAALTSFDYHRPSDHVQGSLTVSDLNGKVGVFGGAETSEYIRCTAHGVSKRFVCIRELEAALVLLQLSI